MSRLKGVRELKVAVFPMTGSANSKLSAQERLNAVSREERYTDLVRFVGRQADADFEESLRRNTFAL